MLITGRLASHEFHEFLQNEINMIIFLPWSLKLTNLIGYFLPAIEILAIYLVLSISKWFIIPEYYREITIVVSMSFDRFCPGAFGIGI